MRIEEGIIKIILVGGLLSFVPSGVVERGCVHVGAGQTNLGRY